MITPPSVPRHPSDAPSCGEKVAPYAVAVVSVAVVALLRKLIDPLMGEHHQFVLFIFPAFLVATRFGWRAGAFALVLGMATANFLFAKPRMSVWVEEPVDQIGLLLFLAVGAGGVYLAESLRRSQATLHLQQGRLLAHAFDPIFTWSLGGAITSWNAGAERLYGYSAKEAVGHVNHVLLQTEFLGGRAVVEESLRRWGHWEGELSHRTKAGTRLTVDSRMSLVERQSSKPQVLEANRDITDRKRAEEARARLAAIVESSEDAIISKALDGTILSWNAGAERLFGYQHHEAVGRLITLIIPPERLHEENEILARLRRGERVEHFETARVARNGRRVEVSLAVSPIRDATGHVIGASKIARDITDRKRDAERLRAGEARLRLFAEHVPTPIAMLDREMRYIHVSRRWLTDYNIGDRDITGATHYEVFPDLPEHWKAVHRRCLAGAIERSEEDRFVRADGISQWIRWEVRPWMQIADEIGGIIIFSEDITERKQSEQALRERERLLRIVTESARVGLVVVNDHYEYLFANEAYAEIFGLDVGGIVGRRVPDILEEGWPQIRPRLDQALAGERVAYELTLPPRPGAVEARWFRVMYEPRTNGTQSPTIVAVITDVTEQKRSEASIGQSEARYRFLFEKNLAAVLLTRGDGAILKANAAAARLFGIESPNTLMTFQMQDFYYDAAERAALASAVVQDRLLPTRELRFRRADGRPIWTLANVSLVEDGPDGPVFHSTLFDITDRKKAEGAARRADDLLRAVVDGITDAVFVKDLEGKYLLFNPAAGRLVGKPPSEVLGKDDTALFDPDCARRVMERDWRVMVTGTVETEEEHLTAGGRTHTYLATKVPYRDEARGIIGVIGISRDVTERNCLAAERDQLLARLQIQIERMPLIYLLFDADFRIIDWNPAAERILGYTKGEALGMRPNDLTPPSFHPELTNILARIRAGDLAAHSVNENLTKAGRTITCEWFNTPLTSEGRFDGLLCLGMDITERKHLEEQYRQSQKMEVVGQLAGGVAHDFNNLLCVINGYGELLLGTLAEGDPAREMIQEMTKAGERAASLTRQLLAFSRKAVLVPEVLDLNAVVADMEKMLRRTIGEDVSLAVDLQSSPSRVKADPGQIEQVLMNLCVNARDAMPKGGKLTLETRDAELDEDYARTHPEVRPGRYVMLAVSDTGHGMTAEVKARIFEPFFTTKEVGRGTGLGLSTVFGIIKQSGGSVEVYSEPGLGTCFKVYLPLVEKEVAPRKSEFRLSLAPRGAETVLLVEDEDSVRALAHIVLTTCGYTVLEASHGEQALQIAGGHARPIQLLVSDVVMPELGGPELAGRLLVLHPEMKVLFLSGYTDDAIVRHGILQEKVNFLQKPFSTAVLARKVREVLDSSS